MGRVQLDVAAPRNPTGWVKGGLWDIVWVEAQEDVLDEADQERYEGAWMYVMKVGLGAYSELDEYDPLDEEPLLFAAFADLGRAVWEAYDGKYLSELQLDPDIPEELRHRARDFIVAWGPPLILQQSWYEAGELWSHSVHTMLREAQLMEVAVCYHRVATWEEGPEKLARYIKPVVAVISHEGTVPASETLSNVAASISKNFALSFAETEMNAAHREAWKRLVDGQNLDTPDSVMEVTEVLLEGWLLEPLRLGGLRLEPERTKANDRAADWNIVLSHKSLFNVMWYQLYRAMFLRSVLRTCRNERCKLPGQIFEPHRTDQRYCSKKCRDAFSAREHRRRDPNRRPGPTDRTFRGVLP